MLFHGGKLFLIHGSLTVVTALDPGGRLHGVEECGGGHAVKNHDEGDGFETGHDKRSIFLAIDRIKLLEIIGGLITVQPDD